jgi:tetratricopeptide (TPR) repeat protein
MTEARETPAEYYFALDKAERLAEEGKHLHALQIFTRLLADFPDEAGTIIPLATLYEKMGNHSSVENVIRHGIKHNPNDPDLRMFGGHYYFKREEWQAAIDILSPMEPDEDPLGTFFIAYSFFMLKNFDEAKKYFDHYIRQNKQDDFISDAYMFMAKACMGLNQFDEAIQLLERVLVYNSDQFGVHLLFAIAYFQLEMYSNAEASIKKALSLANDDPMVNEWAAKIYLATTDYKRSVAYFKTALATTKEENRADLHAGLGLALLYSKNIQDALKHFDAALKIDPSEPTALIGMKKINTESYKFIK